MQWSILGKSRYLPTHINSVKLGMSHVSLNPVSVPAYKVSLFFTRTQGFNYKSSAYLSEWSACIKVNAFHVVYSILGKLKVKKKHQKV